jgi:hypothetical protein
LVNHFIKSQSVAPVIRNKGTTIPRKRASLRVVSSCCAASIGRAERTVVLPGKEASVVGIPVSRRGLVVGVTVTSVAVAEAT